MTIPLLNRKLTKFSIKNLNTQTLLKFKNLTVKKKDQNRIISLGYKLNCPHKLFFAPPCGDSLPRILMRKFLFQSVSLNK